MPELVCSSVDYGTSTGQQQFMLAVAARVPATRQMETDAAFLDDVLSNHAQVNAPPESTGTGTTHQQIQPWHVVGDELPNSMLEVL